VPESFLVFPFTNKENTFGKSPVHVHYKTRQKSRLVLQQCGKRILSCYLNVMYFLFSFIEVFFMTLSLLLVIQLNDIYKMSADSEVIKEETVDGKLFQ